MKQFTMCIHKENIEYWQDLRKYPYFEIIDIIERNDEIYDVTIQYDENRLSMLFCDIFLAGSIRGIDRISNNPRIFSHAKV